MKLLPLVSIIALPLASEGVTVTNYITDTLGNPLYTRVVFTPYTPSTVFGGTNVVGISVGVPCTNGVWYTDVLPGWYHVDQGDGSPAIPIFCAFDAAPNSLAFFASAATNPIPTFAYGVNHTNITLNVSIVLTNAYYEYTWEGPTNSLDFLSNRWYFAASDSVSVTGYVGVVGGPIVQPLTLAISNAVATNIQVNIEGDVKFPTGLSNPFNISTGDIAMFWFEAVNGRIVLVPRGFH